MKSKRTHEGYILIDNRCSEGVSVAGIQASGLAIPIAAARGLFESATITCSHCHAIVILNPDRSRPRGYCRKCDHYVCDNPACNAACTPMWEIIEQAQTRALNQPET